MSQPGDFDRTAVREVCREALPERIDGLEGYARVLVVFRFRRAVVGMADFPVRGGAVAGSELRRSLSGMAWPMWLALWNLRDSVGAPERATIAVIAAGTSPNAQATVRSVLPCAAQGHEVLLVGGEEAASLARGFGLPYRLSGPDAARNTALEAASHEVVALLEAPVLASAGWFPALLARFGDPMTAVALPVQMPAELETPAQLWQDRLYRHYRRFDSRTFDVTDFDPLEAGGLYAGSGFAVRRAAALEAGGFEHGEPEAAFLGRIVECGYRIAHEPSALVWDLHGRDWRDARRAAYEFGAGYARWWATLLGRDRNAGVLRVAPSRFLRRFVVNFVRSALRRTGSIPFDLALDELRGVLSCALRRPAPSSAPGRHRAPHADARPQVSAR